MLESVVKQLTLRKNSFDKHLGGYGFSINQALVNDTLHEIEVGIWKHLFVHLLRLLESYKGQGKIDILNAR